MFLIILEDLEIKKTDVVNDADLEMCDDGIVSIINLNTDQPMEYHDGEWHDIAGV